jgi:Ni/Co efflux regulator RcnB
MNIKSLSAILAVSASLACGGAFAQEAGGDHQPASDKYQGEKIQKSANQSEDATVKDPNSENEYKVGSEAPDKFQRETYQIKDWKAHGLKAPGENEQWVKIGNDYVLLKKTEGAIIEIVKGKDTKK